MEQLPKLALDVHAEIGPARRHRPTISRHEQRRNQARLTFDKIISSHYRDSVNEYTRVGALFVTWEHNDLRLKGEQSEVTRLQSLFRNDLGYETDTFEIPSVKSESSLNKKVADFVNEYDDSNALMVLYYAGHGFEDETLGLGIAAKDKGDHEHGDPQAFFSILMQLLHVARSDILLIIDCCYAAKAFSAKRHGRRKFELLASSMEKTPAPGRSGSFTDTLINVLESLLSDPEYQRGFSTSILYARLFHHPALIKYKPLLFDQSLFDYGKICLRPQRDAKAVELLVRPSEVALDLQLHLSLTKEDDLGLAMNQLAKQLQYLPHVHHIEFKELHAGDADVAMFLQVLGKATTVREVIRRLKARVKQRKKEQLERQMADPVQALRRPDSFHQYILKNDLSATQDWSLGVAKFSDGTKEEMKALSGPRAVLASEIPSSPTTPPLKQHRSRHTFRIPGIIYLTYLLNFTGIWYATSRWLNRIIGTVRVEGHELSPQQTDAQPTPSSKKAEGDKRAQADDAESHHVHHRKTHRRRLITPERVLIAAVVVLWLWKR